MQIHALRQFHYFRGNNVNFYPKKENPFQLRSIPSLTYSSRLHGNLEFWKIRTILLGVPFQRRLTWISTDQIAAIMQCNEHVKRTTKQPIEIYELLPEKTQNYQPRTLQNRQEFKLAHIDIIMRVKSKLTG